MRADQFEFRNPARVFIATLDLRNPFEGVPLPFSVRMVC